MITIFRVIFILLVGLTGLWLWYLYQTEPNLGQIPPQPNPELTPPPEVQKIVGPIDRIVIEKSARRMSIHQDARILRTYDIALGFAPTGDKIKEGDGKTPEGIYKVDRRNPNSSYTLSLGINYPLSDDIARAKQGGYSPGGDIFIHGQPNGFPDERKISDDWTAGCIALSNTEMQEIWDHIPIGTTVEIKP